MSRRFHELAFTPLVQQQQQLHGSRRQYQRMAESSLPGDNLGIHEQAFLAQRDSFYLASVSETGWPYIQHRGGPKGFLHTLDDRTIAFADLRGNKQYISLGNLQHDARVALFLMDYPNQTRLKILGRVEIHEQTPEAERLLKILRPADPNSVPERAILIHVEAFDWNCPQHITPRFTAEELEPALQPLRAQIEQLTEENHRLKAQIAAINTAKP